MRLSLRREPRATIYIQFLLQCQLLFLLSVPPGAESLQGCERQQSSCWTAIIGTELSPVWGWRAFAIVATTVASHNFTFLFTYNNSGILTEIIQQESYKILP